jgi:type I restriction enzyme, S subunit
VTEIPATAKRIKAKLATARQRVKALTPAVLVKAFHSELVPTEADLSRCDGRSYEPADKLLERTQAERVAATTASRKRKQRSKRGIKV